MNHAVGKVRNNRMLKLLLRCTHAYVPVWVCMHARTNVVSHACMCVLVAPETYHHISVYIMAFTYPNILRVPRLLKG